MVRRLGSMKPQEPQEDQFSEYRKRYPNLDINQEFRNAYKKLGKLPGRLYFERWLSFCAADTLEIPESLVEELKEKPKAKREAFIPDPYTEEELVKAYGKEITEGRSKDSSRKTS
jgi:hypothetical protein